MTNRTALPIMIACAALGCGSESGDQGPEVAEFSGTLPSAGTPPATSQNPLTPASPSAPGGVNEAQGSPGLAGPAPAGGPPGAPMATDPTATPAMLDVTIEAETLNQTVSTGFAMEPNGTAVGGVEVGSVLCFDNVDLTGVRSIDLLYARKGSGQMAGSF